MDDRLEGFLRERIRLAGRAVERTKRAYTEGKTGGSVGADLPVDDDGRAKIVCRRHAERRAVPIDARGRPACFDAEHPDCRGCVEDIREGSIEVW